MRNFPIPGAETWCETSTECLKNPTLNRFRNTSSISGGIDRKSMTCVRFSTVIDIGSASFKYDMRRLSEILAFPKAWYRRTLVRRLFLGEFKTTSFHSAATGIICDQLVSR